MKRWFKLTSSVVLLSAVSACSTLDDSQTAEPDVKSRDTASDNAPGAVTAAPTVETAADRVADSDRDGIADQLDRCGETPPGQLVGPDGCSQCNELLAIVTNLNFEFDSAVLTQEAATKLEPIIATLVKNPAIDVSVEGHTDSVGATAYNQKLSDVRAAAVVDYLDQQGVAKTRMKPLGMGESMPLLDNASPAGRAINRRVEFRVDCSE